MEGLLYSRNRLAMSPNGNLRQTPFDILPLHFSGFRFLRQLPKLSVPKRRREIPLQIDHAPLGRSVALDVALWLTAKCVRRALEHRAGCRLPRRSSWPFG